MESERRYILLVAIIMLTLSVAFSLADMDSLSYCYTALTSDNILRSNSTVCSLFLVVWRTERNTHIFPLLATDCIVTLVFIGTMFLLYSRCSD